MVGSKNNDIDFVVTDSKLNSTPLDSSSTAAAAAQHHSITASRAVVRTENAHNHTAQQQHTAAPYSSMQQHHIAVTQQRPQRRVDRRVDESASIKVVQVNIKSTTTHARTHARKDWCSEIYGWFQASNTVEYKGTGVPLLETGEKYTHSYIYIYRSGLLYRLDHSALSAWHRLHRRTCRSSLVRSCWAAQQNTWQKRYVRNEN